MARKETMTPARSARDKRNGTSSCPPAARSTATSITSRQPPAPGAQAARSTATSTSSRQPPAPGAQPVALHGSGDIVTKLAEDLSNRHTLTKLKRLYVELNGKPTRLTSKAGVSRAVALTIATARRTAPLIKEGEVIADLVERPFTWPPPDDVRAVRMSVVEAARGSGSSKAGRIMALLHGTRGSAGERNDRTFLVLDEPREEYCEFFAAAAAHRQALQQLVELTSAELGLRVSAVEAFVTPGGFGRGKTTAPKWQTSPWRQATPPLCGGCRPAGCRRTR